MGFAQGFENYPVQATAYFQGASSQRLSDYFTSNTRLGLDLLLKDLTKSNVQVYLRIAFEGPSIRVFTREGYVPSGFITLQRGSILKLHGNDLQANYFNIDAR